LLVPVIITCTQFVPLQGLKQEYADSRDSAIYEPVSDHFHTLELASRDDLFLALYESPVFHQEVRDFFVDHTGSSFIGDIILEAAIRHDVPVFLAFSLAWAESGFKPDAVNRNSSSIDRGLFQLNNRSFPDLGPAQFFDPEINTDRGLRYLRSCLDLGENRIVALAMYNAGRGRVNSGGTPKMTLDYISKIIDHQIELEEAFFNRFVISTNMSTNVSKDKNMVRYILDTGKGTK
jgi:hypothetical protein